jgi:putative hydrolase of the HAD superfamily
MIKAVFFDLYQTLVRYDPPREDIEATILGDLGIQIDSIALAKPFVAADETLYAAMANRPWSQRTKEERGMIYAHHQSTLLKEAGITQTAELVRAVLSKWRGVDFKLVLFDDVKPVLSQLKASGLILGLISNIDRSVTPMLERLGINQLLSLSVTSEEVGATKPDPRIFEAALARASVNPPEAAYVGDQPEIDMAGAKKVGMKAILLDRHNFYANLSDSFRITDLKHLIEIIKIDNKD